MSASYEFIEGPTSDLCFVARGSSPEASFVAAGDALLAATVEDPGSVRERDTRMVALEEPDLELLLLRFLNELVYLRDAEQLLLRARHLRISRGETVRLEAELVGEPIDVERHELAAEVKAATAHALRVTPVAAREGQDPRWEATVTLDV